MPPKTKFKLKTFDRKGKSVKDEQVFSAGGLKFKLKSGRRAKTIGMAKKAKSPKGRAYEARGEATIGAVKVPMSYTAADIEREMNLVADALNTDVQMADVVRNEIARSVVQVMELPAPADVAAQRAAIVNEVQRMQPDPVVQAIVETNAAQAIVAEDQLRQSSALLIRTNIEMSQQAQEFRSMMKEMAEKPKPSVLRNIFSFVGDVAQKMERNASLLEAQTAGNILALQANVESTSAIKRLAIEPAGGEEARKKHASVVGTYSASKRGASEAAEALQDASKKEANEVVSGFESLVKKIAPVIKATYEVALERAEKKNAETERMIDAYEALSAEERQLFEHADFTPEKQTGKRSQSDGGEPWAKVLGQLKKKAEKRKQARNVEHAVRGLGEAFNLRKEKSSKKQKGDEQEPVSSGLPKGISPPNTERGSGGKAKSKPAETSRFDPTRSDGNKYGGFVKRDSGKIREAQRKLIETYNHHSTNEDTRKRVIRALEKKKIYLIEGSNTN